MNTFPLPASLLTQVLETLRDALQRGVWKRFLPGEHELCRQLHVSRKSVRIALAQLEREGWLRTRQGRRREILCRASGIRHRVANKTIVLLTPKALSIITPFAMFWIDELRRSLAEDGYALKICENENCYSPRPNAALSRLTERTQAAGWVLYLSTPQMQHWFSQQRLPLVIAGSRHPGVTAVSVDLHYRAACRHAASRLASKGHQHIALLVQRSELAGDHESEAGFQEGALRDIRVATRVSIGRHDGTVAGLRAQLDALLQLTDAPTGFLVSTANDVLAAMGHLALRGVRLPQDASLISRDDEPFLKHTVPLAARYSTHPTRIARKLSRCVLEVAQRGVLRPSDYRLIPRFIPGETFGSAPKQPVS